MKVSQESEKVGSECSPERPDALSLRAQNSGKKKNRSAERKGTIPAMIRMHLLMVAVVSKKRDLNGNDVQPSSPDIK